MWTDCHRNICRFQCLNWIEVYSWYAALSLVRDRETVWTSTHPMFESIRLAESHPSPQASFLVEAGDHFVTRTKKYARYITCTFYSHILMSSHLRPSHLNICIAFEHPLKLNHVFVRVVHVCAYFRSTGAVKSDLPSKGLKSLWDLGTLKDP